ncbi:hypothetical protein MRB56_16710 [Halomonas cupida]|nr:hypothetical protein [Halomonas cupida]
MMLLSVIWLIAFAVILALLIKSWDSSVNAVLDRLLPTVLRSDDDRWVWCPAIAVLVATTIVSPIDMLMTLLIIGLLVLIGVKLGCWLMSKVKFH